MALKNRLKLLTNYLKQKPSASHGPVEIGIEVTNHCNLNCIMCNRQEMTRPLGDISWNLFTRIVDQTYQTAEIYNLFGLGEPLLHPALFKMIDYCHQKGVPVAISTNATVLNQKAIKNLINHPPDYLLLALPAATPATYQLITGSADFYQVRKNITRYLQAKQKKKPPTMAILLFIKQKLNQAEAVKFKKYWQNKGASTIYIKPVTKMTNLKIISPPPAHCLFPWRIFNITWQGDVFPCCLDTNCSFKLGNIKKQNVKDIWNGKNWQRLRRSFKNYQLSPLCRSCSVYKPTLPATLAMTLLSELTIKKAIPYLNQLQQSLYF